MSDCPWQPDLWSPQADGERVSRRALHAGLTVPTTRRPRRRHAGLHGASATVMWQRAAEYYRAKPWRGRWETSGGGLLMNQAIHTLDLLQWLVRDGTARQRAKRNPPP